MLGWVFLVGAVLYLVGSYLAESKDFVRGILDILMVVVGLASTLAAIVAVINKIG